MNILRLVTHTPLTSFYPSKSFLLSGLFVPGYILTGVNNILSAPKSILPDEKSVLSDGKSIPSGIKSIPPGVNYILSGADNLPAMTIKI